MNIPATSAVRGKEEEREKGSKAKSKQDDEGYQRRASMIDESYTHSRAFSPNAKHNNILPGTLIREKRDVFTHM